MTMIGILIALLWMPSPAFAVQDAGFELDGNIADDPDPTGRSDWADIFDANGREAALPPHFLGTQFVRDFVPGSQLDTSTFGNGSKDTQNISTGWTCTESNNVADKGDLLNTYATFYVDPGTGDTHLYFGAERFDNSGSGNVGVWFLQDPTVGCVAPVGHGSAPFTGDHIDGDLLLVASFTIGGQVTTITVYRWVGGATGSLDPTPILAGADCRTTPGGEQSVCATSNTTAVTPPWPTEDKDSNNVLDVSEFLEGGFNLTRLGLQLGCFNKILVNSRNASSVVANLADYALGAFVTCNDSNACTVEGCDPAVGCVATPISCDDGNPCTDDGCDPAVGCVHVSNTAFCDDGDTCTTGDTCHDGACIGGGPRCDDGNPCTDDSCDPTGACTHANRTSACDDGNACTVGDTCSDGVCVGEPASCDDGTPCTDDSCDPSSGCVHVNNSAPCDDGDACTQSDTCQAGSCGGAAPVVCAALDGCHEAGICDPATGGCSNPVKSDSARCDDGNACTQTDSCQAGICIGANPMVCAPADLCHDAGTCEPATGQCTNPIRSDGTACNDRNDCTENDTCQSGTCTGSAGAEGTACDDGSTCTRSDTCQSGACVGGDPAEDGAACDDGNSCTQTDTCQSGTCVGSDPAEDGAACDDRNSCTQSDTCQSGTCVGGNPADDETPCDDGNTCTASDTCYGGLCKGNVLPNGSTCDDDNGCTATDTCQADTCLGIAVQDGSACDDGGACTQHDVCGNGKCTGSDPVVCTALDQCHDAGTCDPQSGECSQPTKPTGTACSDGNACTVGDQGDRCDGIGQCVPGTPLVCTAIDGCHDAGTCDPQSGECSQPAKPSGTACSDGNACTRGEQVDRCDEGGQCVPGTLVVCTAIDQCHDAGTCDPQSGECSQPTKPTGTLCSDGNACTRADVCDAAGTCVPGSPRDCMPDDPCHQSGTCDVATGDCVLGPKPVNCGDPVCSNDPSCTEICDNCIDDNGDGLVDRDDPQCAPFVDGSGAGTGDPRQRGKSATKCQATMRSAGLQLANGTRKRLQQCADAVFRCIQQKPGDAGCLAKARARCIKLAAVLTGGPQSLAAKVTTKIDKSCGPKKLALPPRVSREDLCAPSGLGFADEIKACNDPTLSAAEVLDAVADHLVHEHRCRVGQLFTATAPRGAELLTLGDFGVDASECVDHMAEGDSLGLGSPKTVGKAATKCQKTIGTSATRFFQRVVAAYERCTIAVFRCIQQKPDDPRCLPKAEARCGKLTAALFHDERSAEGRLRKTIANACGSPRPGAAPRLDLADVGAVVGLGYDALESRCHTLGVLSLDSLDDVDECLIREHVCRAEQVLTSQMPRSHELLDMGAALRR